MVWYFTIIYSILIALIIAENTALYFDWTLLSLKKIATTSSVQEFGESECITRDIFNFWGILFIKRVNSIIF